MILGLGIGNHEKEFAKLGIPFLPVSERQEALAEAMQIIEGLWGSTPFTYNGKYFQVREANVRPGPVQQPHVPVLLAGGGERVTLRQVAQFADIANFAADKRVGNAFTPSDIVRKYAVLRQHCETLGRTYDSILRSYSAVPVLLAETQARLAAKLEAIPAHIRQGYATSTVAGTPMKSARTTRRSCRLGYATSLLGSSATTWKPFACLPGGLCRNFP